METFPFWKFTRMAIDFRASAFLVILLCGQRIFQGEVTGQGTQNYEVSIMINVNSSVFSVDEKFLSVAIDTGIMRNRWKSLNLSSVRFFTLAKGLSPAYLRVGGTAEDFMTFDPTETAEFSRHKNETNFTITQDDLDKIHLISSKAGWNVMFGLNVLLREKDGSWNASNAKEILSYVADNDYNFGWELGNEPNHFKKFNRSLSAEELAEDFKTLRSILDSTPKFGNFLVGPDVTQVRSSKSLTASYLTSFVSLAKDVIDAVTWHQYYVDGRNCSIKDFYDPAVLDIILRELQIVDSILSQVAPKSSRWLGETGSAFGGGAPGLSDGYVAGFMWLDKLGLAARLGHEIVVRQSFFSGSYAMVDNDLEPNPDYWLSLLHKRLVGQKVLEVVGGTEEMREVRVYAHCASRVYIKGAVTVLAMNIFIDEPVVLKLSGSLEGKDVDEYLLIPDEGDLLSKGVRLNGKLLQLVDEHTLPDLVPRHVPASQPLIMPPLTFGLYVVPEAEATACL